MRAFYSLMVVLLVAAGIALLAACSSSSANPATPSDGDGPEGEADSEAPPSCSAPTTPYVIPAAADNTFDLGPYLMHTTKSSVVLMWRTLTETDGKVLYGRGETLDQNVAQTGASLIHEITLSGLSPQTRYSYKVASGELESQIHHFQTAPGDEQGIRFSVMSDTHGKLPIFTPLLEQVRQFGPQLFLHAGDAIDNGFLPETYKPDFFEPIRAIGHEIPLYLTIGNHEGEQQTWYDLVSYPPPTENDGKHPHEYESDYGFRYGNTYILVVNSNLFFFPISATMETTISKYLKNLLASDEARSATWRVAIAHESGYAEDWGSCFNPDGSVRYDGHELVRKWLLPFLAENHFHAFFSGDVHAYQRGKTDEGLFLFTVGGGGGGLDGWCRDWPQILVTRETHHYLQVEAGCDELAFRAIDAAGQVIDTVTLDRKTYGVAKESGPPDPPHSPVLH